MVSNDQEMTELAMKLRLTRQASERLTRRAAELGSDVASVASRLIEAAVASTPEPTSLDRERRLAELNTWLSEIDTRPKTFPPGFILDDSRESIYEGRGE